MADEQKSDVDDIKIRLGSDDIPVEDETVYKSQAEDPDVVGDFRDLGQQFANTLRSACIVKSGDALNQKCVRVCIPLQPKSIKR